MSRARGGMEGKKYRSLLLGPGGKEKMMCSGVVRGDTRFMNDATSVKI